MSKYTETMVDPTMNSSSFGAADTKMRVITEDTPTDAPPKSYSFIQRQAMRIARWPKTHFWVSFIVAFGLSAFGMIVGEFSVSNEEGGWQSRGTLIADRTTQILMITRHQERLFVEGDEFWEELITNVQPGWEFDDDATDNRRLEEIASTTEGTWLESVVPTRTQALQVAATARQSLPLAHERPELKQFLQERLTTAAANSRRLETCGTEYLNYYMSGNLTSDTRLWPVWKVNSASDTALDPALLEEICINEEQTQRVLQEEGLCITCDGQSGVPGATCLPPYGIVLYARLLLVGEGGMDMDCSDLAAAWGPFQTDTEADWKLCVEHIEANPTSLETGDYLNYCPTFFHPSLLDEFFDTSGNVQYTSTIFATTDSMVDDMYDINDQFGKAASSSVIEGAYDTQHQDFANIFADGAVGADMLLACGSALITTVAILVHTRSPFLTLVGIVQIILSFPLAFFAYRFLGGFNFFPFLNFIGVFVVFALGADHVFVSVDKWKNARLDHPEWTTEEVAARALPDAASAMLLTTTTTAVAFFGTAICPVAPVRLFALFCGMLILFDYVMDVALVFPALCIYDGYRHNLNCCILMTCCCGAPQTEANGDVVATTEDNNKQQPKGSSLDKSNVSATAADSSDDGGSSEEVMTPDANNNNNNNNTKAESPVRISFIRRLLLAYYNLLHALRWPLLVACIAAFAVSVVFAMDLSLPTTSDVRILNDSVEYERAHQWRQNLLYEAISKLGGSMAVVAWGVIPADTGDQDDPASWSQLVLDDTFDPSTKEAQLYLRDYCPRFFGEEFADVPYDGFQCSMNNFDDWLQAESEQFATNGTASDVYLQHCKGETSLPVEPDTFHPCIIGWSQAVQDPDVLAREGVVEIIIFRFNSRVRYDSENDALDKEWHLIEDWMDTDQETAPAEAAGAFFSSVDFWWYDTNLQMFRTAYGSAGIAIAASAVVILLSSRSLVMTVFSVFSIGYVLASVTAMMVAAGWTLGFLESVCFAILIGVSVDFVIHFSHAYVHMPGRVAREVRTKHALIDMGPSILAAAFTTMAGAVIMLFCVITFFTKFAFVLFFAIVQATVGSFVVFLTLTDCIGPVEPTYMADRLVASCKGEEMDGGNERAANTSSGRIVDFVPPSPRIEKLESLEEIDEEVEV